MTSSYVMRPVGLGAFAEYVNGPGSERMRRIAEQYARYTNPGRGAWIGYQRAKSGLKAAVKTGNSEVLVDMISRAPNGMRTHYEQLAAGMAAFMRRYKPEFIATPASTWSYGDLSLSLSQHIGMAIAGRPHIVFPYLKQPALTVDGAKVTWRTLELARDRILPESNVLVLDVRRNKLFRPINRVNRVQLDHWIAAEAAGYVDHWRRVAMPGSAAS